MNNKPNQIFIKVKKAFRSHLNYAQNEEFI